MTKRVLLYTLDSIGEYTIAEDVGDSLMIIGQVEEETDARLFCSAPELLEALQECLGWVNNGVARDVHNKAIAAIAKATGETK